MTKLSVNINKIALIRNSRGSNLPDLRKIAEDIESFGADGITVHPRPDQRHVRFDDIPILKSVVKTEFNIEGFPSPEFIKLVIENKPDQVTLVPDSPEALTSDNGWDTKNNKSLLQDVIAPFKEAGIRVSIFVNADEEMVAAAKDTGTDRIELYTGPYAHHFSINREKAVQPYFLASKVASAVGLGLNAGHDLSLDNLAYFKENTVRLLEVSIGHALVCDALYYGLKNVVGMYRNLIR
jgi:pyridoxine 5-phosphate synthase